MVGGCDTMGNTFNPDRIPHSPFQKRHHRVGTLGNIIDGQVVYMYLNQRLLLACVKFSLALYVNCYAI